jgi:hypothetical protein
MAMNETRMRPAPVRILNPTKVFDPADGFAPLTDPGHVTDATITHRDGRRWMYLAGTVLGKPGIHRFSALLAPKAPLAATGWTLTPGKHDRVKIALLAGYDASHLWDLKGCRHCNPTLSHVCERDGNFWHLEEVRRYGCPSI